MKIKTRLTNIIRDTIRNYDFEDAINDAIDSIDIEQIITDRLNSKIKDIDVEPLITDLVKEMIDEELDSLDIEDEVLTALQDQFQDS